MNRPIITLLDEAARAANHCKREAQFLGDEELLLLFSTHLRMKVEEYQTAMERQETKPLSSTGVAFLREVSEEKAPAPYGN